MIEGRFGFEFFPEKESDFNPDEHLCIDCRKELTGHFCDCKNRVWVWDLDKEKQRVYSYVQLEPGEMIDFVKELILNNRNTFEMVMVEIKAEERLKEYTEGGSKTNDGDNKQKEGYHLVCNKCYMICYYKKQPEENTKCVVCGSNDTEEYDAEKECKDIEKEKRKVYARYLGSGFVEGPFHQPETEPIPKPTKPHIIEDHNKPD